METKKQGPMYVREEANKNKQTIEIVSQDIYWTQKTKILHQEL